MSTPTAGNSPHDPADRPLLHALEQLGPALRDYPVVELLESAACAAPHDRATAYRLVDSCLVHWIAALDATLDTYPAELEDALARVQSRQQGTRDALAKLKVALRAEVVRPNRGQLC